MEVPTLKHFVEMNCDTQEDVVHMKDSAGIRAHEYKHSLINLGLNFKNCFKALSRISEELLLIATMANNVNCF